MLERGIRDAWGKGPNARTLVRDRREVGVGVMFAEETRIHYRKSCSWEEVQGYKTIVRPNAENRKKKKNWDLVFWDFIYKVTVGHLFIYSPICSLNYIY